MMRWKVIFKFWKYAQFLVGQNVLKFVYLLIFMTFDTNGSKLLLVYIFYGPMDLNENQNLSMFMTRFVFM